MKKAMVSLALSGLISTILLGCGGSSSGSSNDAPKLATKAELGEQLFSDKNLSFERNQSCATCHNPDKGFIDDRPNLSSLGNASPAGSLGDNQHSIGDRNALLLNMALESVSQVKRAVVLLIMKAS